MLRLRIRLHSRRKRRRHRQLPPLPTSHEKAGLATPNVFGGIDTKKYIIETTGSGVAIFDYDNDGWPDIFLVNGTTLDGIPTGSSADQSPVPQQSRRHVYRRDREGWS